MPQGKEEPVYALFYGITGCGSAMAFSALGACYATARSGIAVATVAVVRPDMIMKSLVPVIMAGILAIYGLVIAVLIGNDIKKDLMHYSVYKGFTHLGAGLSVGWCSIAAGFAIGLVGDYGVRASALQPQLFIGMILMLIFAEVLGLYGLIVAVFLYAH